MNGLIQIGPISPLRQRLIDDMTIRRFLLHALPCGFHGIRHHGFFASARRKAHFERARCPPAQARA